MKELLTHLIEGNILSKEEAKDALMQIAKGIHSDAEIASFLTIYIMRGVKAQELSGFREAMLDLCVAIDLSAYKTIDVCGTGGDGKHTFNISTLTAFVVAGAGAKVVKHGNYGVSSPSGSSNMLEYLGYQFSNDVHKLKSDLEKANLCYLHAPLFHPAMKNVGPVRKALKLKTFFNILGPLVNPARPQYQLTGVYSGEVQELYAGVFKMAGINHAIVYALDGYDEVSLTSDFRLIAADKDQVLSPSDIGFSHVEPEQIRGGRDVEESAGIFMTILEGNGTDAQNRVVMANAVLALQCYYPDKSLDECKVMAEESLLGKKALTVVKKLIQ
ncbi:MAG: anthranilate phosphoribosyltransferase [Bacteroidetes bacterium]|jgi:anthranilate phosphoribosyltransferase|nr:anthranilate phosphoribosyltransferase [Bacteroidota bacterium]